VGSVGNGVSVGSVEKGKWRENSKEIQNVQNDQNIK